jgi:two-component system, cell cycle response regulator
MSDGVAQVLANPVALPAWRRIAVPAFWAVVFGGLAALTLHSAFGLGGAGADEFFSTWIYDGLIVLSGGACLARAIVMRVERAAWLALGLGVMAWGAGEIYYSAVLAGMDSPPYPSVSDACFVAFYPVTFVGLFLLVRSRLREAPASMWLDGITTALAVSSLAAALVFGRVTDSLDVVSGFLPRAASLAYPVGDLLLLGSVMAVLALSGWRPSRAWALIGAGLALVAIADFVYLYETADQSYVEGGLLDVMWPAGMVLIGWAAWRPRRVDSVRLEGWRILLLPSVFALMAVGVLIADRISPLSGVSIGLAIATAVTVIVRTAWSLRENLTLLQNSRVEALTDALTGLGNRRQLLADLEREVEWASAEDPRILVLFDLDGFKSYNDAFGHLAGDSLLSRLGGNLKAAVEPYGSSYRLGGDEFCALITTVPPGAPAVIAAAAASLSDRGEGFEVTASYGVVALPGEARSTSNTLALADQRVYSRKDARPSSARRQSADVLLSVLREREPDLHQHVNGVADLALAVGRDMGMTADELDELVRAAELHDVGKIAIPDEILNKPGKLAPEEWEFIRRHTLLGERILKGAPELLPVAKIVRSSHERWDGGGYPDKLAGEEIPLGARIVAVCDAFDAMVSDRPYRPAITVDEALDELERCAGSQFDPKVVESCRRLIGTEGAGTGPRAVQAATATAR